MPTSLDNGRRSPCKLLRAVVARLLWRKPLKSRKRDECAGVTPCRFFAPPIPGLMAVPGGSARPPAGDRTEVGLIVGAELTAKCRLFVPANESRNGKKERPRVEQQQRLSQYECLSDDRGRDGQIHRISDVAIEPADDQMLGGSDGSGSANPFVDEACERLHYDDHTRSDENPPQDSNESPAGQWLFLLPSGQPPGDKACDDPRRHREEYEAA